MTHETMPADGFAAVIEYLDLDVETAAVAFGVPVSEIVEMLTGARLVPFLVSLATVLMCESEKATQLAIQHGLAMRSGEPELADLLAQATSVGFMLKARPKLQLVKDED